VGNQCWRTKVRRLCKISVGGHAHDVTFVRRHQKALETPKSPVEAFNARGRDWEENGMRKIRKGSEGLVGSHELSLKSCWSLQVPIDCQPLLNFKLIRKLIFVHVNY
jgi:hypothetical protein